MTIFMLLLIQHASAAPEIARAGTMSYVAAAGGWLHIVSDAVILGAYLPVLVLVALFLRRHRDAPFPKIWLLLPAFIFACGVGHLSVATDWLPWFPESGL